MAVQASIDVYYIRFHLFPEDHLIIVVWPGRIVKQISLYDEFVHMVSVASVI